MNRFYILTRPLFRGSGRNMYFLLVFRSILNKIFWDLITFSFNGKAIWVIGNVTNSNFFFRWLLVGEIGFTGYELYLGIGKYIFYRTFEYERNHTQPGMNQRERLRGVHTINPSIYNIICWVAWMMWQMNCRSSVWCSKYHFLSRFLAKFFANILSIYFLIKFTEIRIKSFECPS